MAAPDDDSPDRHGLAARAVFLAAICFAVIMAIIPQAPRIPTAGGDKILHVTAFLVLTVLARMAYPRAKGRLILIGLAGLGGGIEVIQAIPGLNRTASLADWIADCLAVLAGLLLIAGIRKAARSGRTRLRRAPSGAVGASAMVAERSPRGAGPAVRSSSPRFQANAGNQRVAGRPHGPGTP